MTQTNTESMTSTDSHKYNAETSSDAEDCGSERFATLIKMEEDDQWAALLESPGAASVLRTRQLSSTTIRHADDLESQTESIARQLQ
jgi:hypothetical protein